MVSENTWRRIVLCGWKDAGDFFELEKESKENGRTWEEEMRGGVCAK